MFHVLLIEIFRDTVMTMLHVPAYMFILHVEIFRDTVMTMLHVPTYMFILYMLKCSMYY